MMQSDHQSHVTNAQAANWKAAACTGPCPGDSANDQSPESKATSALLGVRQRKQVAKGHRGDVDTFHV